jgi:hypothetical protein
VAEWQIAILAVSATLNLVLGTRTVINGAAKGTLAVHSERITRLETKIEGLAGTVKGMGDKLDRLLERGGRGT